MADVIFNYGEKENVPSTITNGNLYVTTDTKELIVDINGVRVDIPESDSNKQDVLTVNPSTTTSTLTGLGINGINYKVEGGVTGVTVNGTSVVTSGVANIVTNTAYNASSNKIATMTDITNAITDAINGSY